MPKVGSSLQKILDVEEEKDPDLIKSFDINSKEGDVFICFIAPYVGIKISPSQEVWASIGLSEEFGIESIIERVRESLRLGPNEGKKKIKRLYLLINSPGGIVASSYKVAKALRKSFNEIIVFVPHLAASGGTLMALSGNKIVMGTMSQLSPLDPSSQESSALSVTRGFESVSEYLTTVSEEDVPYSYKAIAQKFSAEKIDKAVSALELMKKYSKNILCLSGYKEAECDMISKQLVTGCIDHSEVIDYEMAKEIGLKVKKDSDYASLWEVFRKWLGEYVLASADKHVIRYWVNSGSNNDDKIKKDIGIKEMKKKKGGNQIGRD